MRSSILAYVFSIAVLACCAGQGSGCGANASKPSNAGSASASPPAREKTSATCRDALRNCASFPLGVAVEPQLLRENEAYRKVIVTHFNLVVPDNAMKMRPIHPNVDRFTWTDADEVVQFASKNALAVHGHTLISDKEWQLPRWVSDFEGTQQEFRRLLQQHVKGIVSHYKGRVASWDVVNEAFVGEDDPATRPRRAPDGRARPVQTPGELRRNIFVEKAGENYIALAFRWARQADPSAKLFYNEYDLERSPRKLEAVLKMVDDFRRQDPPVPIDGIGFQLHVRVRDLPTQGQLTHALGALVKRGLLVRFSEVDISMKVARGEQPAMQLTDELAERQKQAYRDIIGSFGNVPRHLRAGITLWGVSDSNTWLTSGLRARDGQRDWPLLFDAQFRPKRAFDGFAEGLRLIPE